MEWGNMNFEESENARDAEEQLAERWGGLASNENERRTTSHENQIDAWMKELEQALGVRFGKELRVRWVR